MTDIVTIGHSTLDYFLQIDEASLLCSAEPEKQLLCLEYADKIPVSSWVEAVGGNAANSAVGLARLGLKVGIVTSIGDDKEGETVVRALGHEGVRTDWVTVEKGGTTDESVILNYKGERTILAYHVPREYHLPSNLPSAQWIYLTSLNEKFTLLHNELLEWLKEHPETKLAYNPGMHELGRELEIERIRELEKKLLGKCQVLILNKEEGQEFFKSFSANPLISNKLIRSNDRDKTKKLLKSLFDLGPKIVVITDGANGTYSFDGKDFLFCDIFPAERIEMTGAGDSFSAGFLAALISDKSIGEAMRWGNANSASVIQKIGSQAGLLSQTELDIILGENVGVMKI